MKTLLKNRRTYRNRIGAPDDDHATMKNEGSDDEDPHDGNNTDSWDEMYQTDKEGDNGEDKGDNVEDGDEEGGDGIKDGDEERGVDNEEDEVKLEISGSRDGGGDEGGSEDGDRNNGKEGYGSCSVSGRKDDEGRNRMKRKNRDDEPVTRAKRTKRDVSGGHQATQLMKKLLLRKKSGKK